jgi:hypothetical protein
MGAISAMMSLYAANPKGVLQSSLRLFLERLSIPEESLTILPGESPWIPLSPAAGIIFQGWDGSCGWLDDVSHMTCLCSISQNLNR